MNPSYIWLDESGTFLAIIALTFNVQKDGVAESLYIF